jgi:hypothetical protein
LTKFTILRTLKSKTADEVAYQLMDIFCIFGAPFILQSDNGRECANKIIQNLAEKWEGMKLVHGKLRHSQSHGSVEKSNQDVRDMLVAWMSDNNTITWSEGLRFIQSIKTSTYEARFGAAQRMGLADSPFTEDIYSSIETKEEMEQLFNAGMKNSRDKEEANQEPRKDEDENQTNETSEETTEKKDDKKFTVICEESPGAHKCSACGSLFMISVEDTVKTVRVSDRKSLASSLSLRSASMITSVSKQGFVSCDCKRHCIDKKWKCRSKNIKCNSKCHSNSPCKNKLALPLFLIRHTLHVF